MIKIDENYWSKISVPNKPNTLHQNEMYIHKINEKLYLVVVNHGANLAMLTVGVTTTEELEWFLRMLLVTRKLDLKKQNQAYEIWYFVIGNINIHSNTPEQFEEMVETELKNLQNSKYTIAFWR